MKDLHTHLNGILSVDDVAEIARHAGLRLAAEDFDSLQIMDPVKDYTDYFIPWRILRQLPKTHSCHRLIWEHAARQLARSQVRYVEVQFSPSTLARCASLSILESIQWISEAADSASSIYGVEMWPIITVNRVETTKDYLDDLSIALRKTKQSRIAGIGLTGDESEPVPKIASSFFREISKDLDIGVTIHAGELGSRENIKWAITECGASRIGHGLAASQCPDTIQLIKSYGCCIECCMTSNFLSGCVKSYDEHPLKVFIEEGVNVSVCTDNPGIHNVDLNAERILVDSVISEWGLSRNFVDCSGNYCFR